MDDLEWVDDENSSFEADETLWKRLENLRFKDGFKDGTVEGGERALQLGFNLGYKQTIKQLYQVAKIKGVIINVIELMQADGTYHQTQNETDSLRRELEDDWAAYVIHLKNTNTTFVTDSLLHAKSGKSSADNAEVKSNSVVDGSPCTKDESCGKSKPLFQDVAPSEISLPSRTQIVGNSYVKASFHDNCSEKMADNIRSSALDTAEDNKTSSVMAAACKLIEYKVPETTLTEVTSVKGMSSKGNHDPCDIISVLTCDLCLHTDELDKMGKSICEKYVLKLETLLKKWRTE